LARQHVRPPARRNAHYLERYDRSTLFYDCVYQSDRAGYLLTAPRFLNLWPQVKTGLRRGGERLRLRRIRSGKYEQLWIPGPAEPLSLTLNGTDYPLTARPDLSQSFAGLNCAVTMNKDNDPAWIRDWARYHIKTHGLEAVLIFDNGSTAYGLDQLGEALADLPGLRRVVLASAPYPYGPRDSGKGFEVRPKFLQPAMLNLARCDLLRRARVVLNVDIDELVLKRGADTVFDACAKTRLKALHLPGQWAYPEAMEQGPAGHAAHIWRVSGKASNPKWAGIPGQGLSHFGWFVHHLGGELFRLLPKRHDLEFVHCRGTSTGWKGTRFQQPGEMTRDPELVALMAESFSPGEAE
ncbi:MAG: hypothetical protein ACPGVJ_07540, partial [Mangrovicoccus sp.]